MDTSFTLFIYIDKFVCSYFEVDTTERQRNLCTNAFTHLGVIVKRDNSSEKEELIKGKEVILSAGTIGSAQILLLSGIGPQNELEKYSKHRVEGSRLF